jgi:spore coat polysaccharide biosynthesis predicted glycosyltransferase SpsG
VSDTALVVFDVRGSQRTGIGHVVRALELAGRLANRGARVRFLPLGGRQATRLVTRRSFPVRSLARMSAKEPPTIVVVDRPDVKPARLRRLRRRWPQAVLVVLDYYGAAVRGIDAVINLNRWRVRAGRTWDGTCRYRLGLQFATLRASFRRARPARTAAGGPLRRIFLGFGGTDAAGWTARAITALVSLGGTAPILEVVLGRRVPAVERAARAAGAARVRIHVAIADPAAVLRGCDLAVVGGGTLMMEAGCLGIPAIVVPRTQAERLFVRDFVRGGAVVVVPGARGLPVRRLVAAVTALAHDRARRRQMAAAGRRLIDGRGADRVLALVSTLERHAT